MTTDPTLQDAALACLLSGDVDEKLSLTAALARCGLPLAASDSIANSLPDVGRPPLPRLVEPRQLSQRGLGTPAGRAAFIHAIAHIEFNAVNLALDAVYRFRGMPAQFYADWLSVAEDEARHHALLAERLKAHGHAYGDFDAHNGLWQMALATQHSCLERMALVPRVLEARGLDVTPMMIERLERAGDHETAEVLRLILREEVRHVAIGSHWFTWCCTHAGVDPESTFEHLIQTHARGAIRAPFNHEQRRAAGFSEREMSVLGRIDAEGRAR